MSSAARGSFDQVAKIYDASRGLPPEAEAAMAEALAGVFRRAGSSPRILEVGVGTGRIALPLSDHGCRITGVDIAQGMLAELRRKGAAVDPTIGSAHGLPFAADTFDGALFVHVLHLVSDPSHAIREALGVVRPGGVLAFGGEDFWQSNVVSDARRLTREAIREVTGLELGGPGAHVKVLEAIQGELAAAGSPVERVPLARWESRISGQELLGQLEHKDMSWMWPLPDEDLPAVLEVLRPRLRELCGGLEQAHGVPRSMSALVAQLA